MAGNAYGGPPVGAVGRLVTPFSLGNGTTFAGLPTTASKWFAQTSAATGSASWRRRCGYTGQGECDRPAVASGPDRDRRIRIGKRCSRSQFRGPDNGRTPLSTPGRSEGSADVVASGCSTQRRRCRVELARMGARDRIVAGGGGS
jgi:hypothetical protein